MSKYSEHFGQATHYHTDGSITDAFAKMAGNDVGPATTIENAATADLGFDPTRAI